jgi:hypothetical protein
MAAEEVMGIASLNPSYAAVSAEKDPSSVADCVRDTFSHKGRREAWLWIR